MMKKNNKKGFTLAELLIVVAIIAVLTAIAIPVFSAQLNKSKAATDLANIRSGYAAATSGFLLGDFDGDADDTWDTVTLLNDGTVTADENPDNAYTCRGSSDNVSDENASIGGLTVKTGFDWGVGDTITFTFDKDGVSAINNISTT